MARPPRRFGRLTMLLLLILREAPAPTVFLAFHLGVDTRKLSTYLSRLRSRGLVDYDEYGIWYLTEEGRKFIASIYESSFKLKNIMNYIAETNMTTLIHRNATEMQHLSYTNATLIHKAEQLLGRPLDDVEKAILEYLDDFTRKTQRKYWWPPEPVPLHLALQDELERRGISSIDSEEIERALRELEAAGVLYLTFDKRRGVAKVRISRALRG
ncbi:MAG: hypothetical protein F7C35_08245 [Desulfurococcales archaeon]|nr:hypothetical protein [Desulfurococcales archaeon]